jgi:hypothetical protein
MAKILNWFKIQPTLLGSNYHRYEVYSYTKDTLHVFVKMPAIGMEGCDRCAGPHRKKNKRCSKTRGIEPFIPSPPSNEGGIYLYELDTEFKIPGKWEITSWDHRNNSRSALAILERKG